MPSSEKTNPKKELEIALRLVKGQVDIRVFLVNFFQCLVMICLSFAKDNVIITSLLMLNEPGAVH